MFTGIVEEVGTIEAVKRGSASSVLRIAASVVMEDLRLGDSVSVDGVCLTARELNPRSFCADVMNETLQRSTLGTLKQGSKVNLERALSAQGRFGGHIVSGHIDGTGTITQIKRDDNAVWYTVGTSAALLRYIVEKGSVALDGISLTVARVSERDFSVSIIPHTQSNTTLAGKRTGDSVNIENDVLGKYVEKLLAFTDAGNRNSKAASVLTQEFLMQNGF